MAKGNNSAKHLSEAYVNQLNVLKALTSDSKVNCQPKHLDITAIAQMSGLRDEKETQRYLYILEGHKLVAPHPPGDFTSKLWHITEDGMKAFKTISSESTM